MGSAAIVAGAIDALILRVRKKSWEFPSGAVLTAMIVAMVLRAQEPWYVVAVTAVAAVLSKYLLRARLANVFNPAALAIVASFYVFHTGQSWWGALPERSLAAQLVLPVVGLFIADRVNKMPLVLAFLASYFLLFTLTAFVSEPAGSRKYSALRMSKQCCSSPSSFSPIRQPRRPSTPTKSCAASW
ncbi:MAG: RnfABCDGE type electron transport complex subunit D [Ignavibacteriota bacterium]